MGEKEEEGKDLEAKTAQNMTGLKKAVIRNQLVKKVKVPKLTQEKMPKK